MSIAHLVKSETDARAAGNAPLLAQALLDNPTESKQRTFCYTRPPEKPQGGGDSPYSGYSRGVRVGVIRTGLHLQAAIFEMAEVEVMSLESWRNPLTSIRSSAPPSAMVDALNERVVVRVSIPEFQAVPSVTVQSALTGTAGRN